MLFTLDDAVLAGFLLCSSRAADRWDLLVADATRCAFGPPNRGRPERQLSWVDGPQPSERSDADRGVSQTRTLPPGLDARHRFVLNGVYDLPFGRGRGRAILGGWQLSGIIRVQSGFPVTVGRIINNGQSANLDNPSIDRWFNKPLDPMALLRELTQELGSE